MRSSRSALAVFLLAGALTFIWSACAPAAAPGATPGAKATPASTTAAAALDKPLDPPFTVKLAIIPVFSSINTYTAIEKGFFKEQGLSVDLINFDSGAKMIAPLATGEAHIGGGAVSAGLLNAIQRDLPLKIVADLNSATRSPSTLAFVVRKDLADSGAIKSYADWKGKTVGINATGVFSEIALDTALKKGGLTVKDINLVMLPFDQVPLAMANKSADIALTNEPFVQLGIDQGVQARLIDIADLEPGRVYSVVFYSPVFVKENPEAAKRWMLAYLKGVRYYDNALQTKQGKAELIGILSKYTSVSDPGFYERASFPTTNLDGYVNEKSVAADQDWFVANGSVKEKRDLSTIIDNQYVDYAISKLGRLR